MSKGQETIDRAFLTKNALTVGIQVVSGKVDAEDGYLSYGYCELANKRQWHRTGLAAIQRAEEMRTKKIESLEKQIKSLKAMKFEIKEPS